MSGLLILGAGGHGRVVAFTARSAGTWTEIAFLDDRFPEIEAIDETSVLGRFETAAGLVGRFAEAIVAIGEGRARLQTLRHLRQGGFDLPVLVHPSAVISEHAILGAGSVVFAHCVVHPGTVAGEGCIINTAATVDHDCRLGSGVHLSPGVHLGGDVHVGDLTWLGVGASVRNGVRIGSRVMVGVGAAVVEDLPDGVTAVGVPARVVADDRVADDR